jgi:hypothetical protein
MAQTLREKAEAIATLLPLLHAYHCLIDQVRSSIDYPREPDGEPPRRPGESSDQSWLEMERHLRRRYRLEAVQRSLLRLADVRPFMAAAVYFEHVEPWPEWNPASRPRYARAGLRFMAAEIPGEVRPFAPLLESAARSEEDSRRERDLEIRRLAAHGHRPQVLARIYGLSPRHIRRICRAA